MAETLLESCAWYKVNGSFSPLLLRGWIFIKTFKVMVVTNTLIATEAGT